MRAPLSERTPDEIVERAKEITKEIVTLLAEERKEKDLLSADKSPPGEDSGVAIGLSLGCVQSVIDFLRAVRDTPLYGYRSDNTEGIKDYRRGLKIAYRALKKMPAVELIRFMIGDHDIPSDADQKLALKLVAERATFYATEIARCDDRLRNQLGIHKSADYRKQLAAREAIGLLKQHGLLPGSGKPTQTYGKVACLLFEAMTG